MRASLRRMTDLIDNILLHAKSRLGGGIRITATPNAPLAQAIEQIVEEVRVAAPSHEITLDLSFDRTVSCDAPRVAQAVANLLSNAVRHAENGTPVEVIGMIRNDEVDISVANRGQAIPDTVQKNLFKPFQRGAKTAGEGLGLGLHIASSIAAAHNGRIEVTCTQGITTFAFKLPLLAS